MRTKLNIDLLKRLRTSFLKMRHAEHFNMDSLAIKNECGTAMCIAGHALQLQGYRFRYRDGGYLDSVTTPNGRTIKHHIMKVAAREMGLPYRYRYYDRNDAYQLFHDFNIRTPKQAANRIQELIESVEVK
jgi:hypothetical protein